MLTVSLLVCAMIALARADDVAEPTCPDGFREMNNRCVHYEETERSWSDSEKHCQSLEANLASVHSDLDYRLIQMLMKINDTLPNAWIGGSDCQKEGSWLWSDGSVFDFQSWCAREPNNIDENQHCIEMNFGADHCWNDVDCATKLPSICVTGMK